MALTHLPLVVASLATRAQGEDTTTTTEPQNPAEGLVEGLSDLESACGPDDSWFCDQVYEWTGSRRWAGAAEWFVTKPVTILVIVIVAWVVSRVLRWFIKRTIERTMLDPEHRQRLERLRKRTPNVLQATQETGLRAEARAQTLIIVFRGIATVLVWFVALVAALGVIEINLGPLLAGAGIAGVALGFGAQNLVRDFLSGTFIILEDQYGVGDIVDLGDAVGTVEKVTLRVTRLRDIDGNVWHVPNGEILRVANKSQDWARALLDVDVAYDSDLELAGEVVRRTAEAMAADPDWSGQILETPEYWGVERFGADGITLRVVVKTQPGVQWNVLRQLRRRLKVAFDEAGIEIPFPQRTLWIRQDGGDADALRPDGGADADADDRDDTTG